MVGLFTLSSSNEYVSSRRTNGGREGAPPNRLEVGFMGGKVADCPNWPCSYEFPHFQPESWPWARSSMNRGGGSGGGARASLVPGIVIGVRTDEDDEDDRADIGLDGG